MLLLGAWPRASSREAGGRRGDLVCETEAPCVGLDELGLRRAHGASVGGRESEESAGQWRVCAAMGLAMGPATRDMDLDMDLLHLLRQVSWGELWVRGHGSEGTSLPVSG